MKKRLVIALVLLILLSTYKPQELSLTSKFNILEINTQPGMTNLSLVPEIAKYKGLSFETLVEKILLDASINR